MANASPLPQAGVLDARDADRCGPGGDEDEYTLAGSTSSSPSAGRRPRVAVAEAAGAPRRNAEAAHMTLRSPWPGRDDATFVIDAKYHGNTVASSTTPATRHARPLSTCHEPPSSRSSAQRPYCTELVGLRLAPRPEPRREPPHLPLRRSDLPRPPPLGKEALPPLSMSKACMYYS